LSSVEQETNTWGAILISGQAAFLAILILSDKALAAACAQQEPQY